MPDGPATSAEALGWGQMAAMAEANLLTSRSCWRHHTQSAHASLQVGGVPHPQLTCSPARLTSLTKACTVSLSTSLLKRRRALKMRDSWTVMKGE